MNQESIIAARQQIGQRLKKIRTDKGISKNSIMRSHGLRMEEIGKIESGDSGYTVDKLIAYMAAIGVDFPLP